MTIIVPEWILWLVAIYCPISLALDAMNLYYRRKLERLERES